MTTIKTDKVLMNFKGEPLKNRDEDLTIGTAISVVLSGKVSNPTLGWVLGKKFANDEEVDLKAEDVVFLKRELETQDVWTAVVTGQIIEILEGNDTETPRPPKKK